MKRRNFLKAGIIGLGLVLAPELAFSQESLDKKINQIPLVPLSTALAHENTGKKFKAIYWSKEDLDKPSKDRKKSYYYPNSKDIFIANQDLKADHGEPLICLIQKADLRGNQEFLGRIKDIEELCKGKQAINHFTRKYNWDRALDLLLEETKDDTVQISPPTRFRFITIPEGTPQKYFPSESFFNRKYQEALENKTEKEFLEHYRQYVREFSKLIKQLGFDLYISLNPSEFRDYALPLTQEWIKNSHPHIQTALEFNTQQDLSPFEEIIQNSNYIMLTKPSESLEDLKKIKNLGFKGSFLIRN